MQRQPCEVEAAGCPWVQFRDQGVAWWKVPIIIYYYYYGGGGGRPAAIAMGGVAWSSVMHRR